MTGLLFILMLAGFVWGLRLQKRLAQLERDHERLEHEVARLPFSPNTQAHATLGERAAMPMPVAPTLPELHTKANSLPPRPVPPPAPQPPAPTPASPPPPPPPPPASRPTLESLIGGRLPVWIGGAALVLAGFFLVRYSIESGLLGPGVRTITAALFALALVTGSEVARRLPATRDDPRIGQALAGAGVASLYATLYLAGAMYQLIGAGTAFALLVVVTGLALALSLRQGPPTAAMALIGGFVAPLIAGHDSAGIGPLLVYLGLFIAALFGLAAWRGWSWLALAATIAGFGWINFLALTLETDSLAGVGLFTVALAVAASATLPRTGLRSRWLAVAPLALGLVQLAALAPTLDFGLLAWSFTLVLAAAALLLAWRDTVFLPGAGAALVLVLALLALGLLEPTRGVTRGAAPLVALLFALPGLALSRRGGIWSALVAGGAAAPVLLAHALAPSLLADWQWAGLELIGALACAALAWRHRDRINLGDIGLLAGTAGAALLATVALGTLVGRDWLSLPLAVAIAGLGLWARRTEDERLRLFGAVPFAVALVAAGSQLYDLAEAIARALFGERLIYPLLPQPLAMLRSLALPLMAAAGLWTLDPRQFARLRPAVAALGTVVTLLVIYVLAKQPLAIATPQAFERFGFVERTLITQLCLAAGFGLLRTKRQMQLGTALMTLGYLRFTWFDLVLLNPALVAQWAGPLPLINLAVAHCALAALWLYFLPVSGRSRMPMLLLVGITVAAAVREAAHGSIMTGPVESGETWGYSAAYLLLSLFWLWRGIAAGARDLRIAGLALLTLVTLKVFLLDAAAIGGVLRILSFLGLGVALIGIGWAYQRFLGSAPPEPHAAD